MEYKILGRTGFNISRVSFGCMSLKAASSQNNEAIIAHAVASGINLFDTADLYEHGENEKLLGRALKGRRQDVHISTKVGNRWKEDGSGWEWCPRKAYILEAIDGSLRRLDTDYIDLYLLHGGTAEDPADEVLEAFERLKDSGKIREYGISSIRPNVIREYVKHPGIAAVMTQYSYLDRRPEEETLALLQQNNIGVLARGAMAGGLLAGKPAYGYLDMDAEEIADKVISFRNALPGGLDPDIAAYQYVAAHPSVTSVLAGPRTMEQLQRAVLTFSGKQLTENEYRDILNSVRPNVYKEHR